MTCRWLIKKEQANQDREVLQTIILYAPNENILQIKKEHKGKFDRKLLSVDA